MNIHSQEKCDSITQPLKLQSNKVAIFPEYLVIIKKAFSAAVIAADMQVLNLDS